MKKMKRLGIISGIIIGIIGASCELFSRLNPQQPVPPRELTPETPEAVLINLGRAYKHAKTDNYKGLQRYLRCLLSPEEGKKIGLTFEFRYKPKSTRPDEPVRVWGYETEEVIHRKMFKKLFKITLNLSVKEKDFKYELSRPYQLATIKRVFYDMDLTFIGREPYTVTGFSTFKLVNIGGRARAKGDRLDLDQPSEDPQNPACWKIYYWEDEPRD
jgi:hypothetical protein